MYSETSLSSPEVTLTPLPLEFYERSTDNVANDLLGKLLVRKINNIDNDNVFVSGRIVEVEAYFGPGDPASHAYRGPTPRSSIMFGRAGVAYVYLNYGVHSLLNIVTDVDGKAGAVLLRAIEPVIGIDYMQANRHVKRAIDLTNGPGKLTKAIGVSLEHNGTDITKFENGLFVAEDNSVLAPHKIIASQRIGIKEGRELMLRFSIEGNPYVSR